MAMKTIVLTLFVFCLQPKIFFQVFADSENDFQGNISINASPKKAKHVGQQTDSRNEIQSEFQTDNRPYRACHFGFVDPNQPNPNSKFRRPSEATMSPRPPSRSREYKPRFRGTRSSKLAKDSSTITWWLWAEALGASIILSVVPVLILYWVTQDNIIDAEHPTWLKAGLAFAAGGLLGDAFLHLIPHAIFSEWETNEHGHSHGSGEVSYFTVCLKLFVVICGIFVFFVVEKFMRYGLGHHNHSHGHSHAHPHPPPPPPPPAGLRRSETELLVLDQDLRKRFADGHDKRDDQVNAGGDSPKGLNPLPKVLPMPAMPPDEANPDDSVTGYLNFVADCLHSFIDGLFIGASFLAGKRVGYITMFTVLCHEVPHKIGDYAILRKSGATKNRAITLLLISTLTGSLSGTLASLIVSLLTDGIGRLATAWIMPFAAGGFIYIALVSVYPELTQCNNLWEFSIELLAMFTGVGIMIIIAFVE